MPDKIDEIQVIREKEVIEVKKAENTSHQFYKSSDQLFNAGYTREEAGQ